MYGCTALPWIGPGRTRATWTVRSSRFSGRVRRSDCICARLSIWKQPTVSARWISSNTAGSSSGTRERSICRAARACDQVDALLDRGEHSQPQQVDLQESRVGARVLVPLAHLPACHRGRLHGDELDERARRDDHPAGVLRDVARQAGDLRAQLGERAPARRGELLRRVRQQRHLLGDACRVPAVGELRQPLELRERKTERLADVADRAARAIRGEARDERGMLAPVLLGDADDQLLADVPREVQVDVRYRRELAVEKAAEREVGGDRVDVRQPGQVADERADGGAAAAARRQDVAHRAGAAHLGCDLARELQHLPVEQEEPGEAELVDQHRAPRPAARRTRRFWTVQTSIALRRTARAQIAPQLHDRRVGPVREVGIPVAELLRQVEREPLRELGGAQHRVPVVGEALEHFLGRCEHALVVAAPLALAAVERGARADRDEHVLERGAARVVRVHVSRRDGVHVQRLRQVAQRRVAARVAAFVRSLQLDEEAVAAERLREPRRGVRIAHRQPVPRAAGETDEPLVEPFEQARVERRRQRLPSFLRTRPRMRGGEQPAEVRVALRGLDEQRDVRAAVEGELRPGDRPHAEMLRRVRELERAVDAVVVGEGERRVAELRRPGRQLLRLRRAVEERVGRVRVELDVAHPRVLHEHMFYCISFVRESRPRLRVRLVVPVPSARARVLPAVARRSPVPRRAATAPPRHGSALSAIRRVRVGSRRGGR